MHREGEAYVCTGGLKLLTSGGHIHTHTQTHTITLCKQHNKRLHVFPLTLSVVIWVLAAAIFKPEISLCNQLRHNEPDL